MIHLKSANEIEILRECNQIVAVILNTLKKHCQPGITTLELDKIAEDLTFKYKAKAAFKGYKGFPGTLCTSVNEEVVHGIPSNRVLKDGDVVSIDYGVFHRDFYGDAAVTIPVGQVSKEVEFLLQTTQESLALGIEKALPGNHLGDIAAAIQGHAESRGFSLVKEFSGHGVGRNLHEEPAVLNYVSNGRGISLKPGLVLAIEPMVNQGTDKVIILDDKWTVITQDGKKSAHFEHSIAITENGPEILSLGI
ncbi:MAG: type I methionyl aminopeptidase [Acidobacteriia bacterium]|jgi:methionyl aminopeptidase|nr:type I methionyl aminopeptidase [Terriglobia bacterium]